MEIVNRTFLKQNEWAGNTSITQFSQPVESRLIIMRIMMATLKKVKTPCPISRPELYLRARTQLLKGPQESKIFTTWQMYGVKIY